MKSIHPEFAYQSRELGIQIEDTLGDPPDRKTYAKVINALIEEFARGSEIDDVNLLAFALVDQLQFNDPAGLLAQCQHYKGIDAASVLSMVSCKDDKADLAVIMVSEQNPELARQAILSAFLYKNPKRWTAEDHTLATLQKSENGDDEDEEQLTSGYNIEHLFDAGGDHND